MAAKQADMALQQEGSSHEKAALAESPSDNMFEPEDGENYEMDDQEMKRILRKIDWAIVPYSSLL
jgi:hypothetical protein